MIAVYYDANALFVQGRPQAFVAGTLTAFATGDVVTVQSLNNSDNMVSASYSLITRRDGSSFTSAADCLAYLAGQFAMRRSLDIPTASGVAGADLVQGLPVTISRSSGQIVPARADTYTLSFVAGLCAAATASGFVANATRNSITLSDWTAIAGTQSLLVGQPYFLAPAGGMTPAVPAKPSCACSVRVGQATSPQTFLFLQSDPILL